MSESKGLESIFKEAVQNEMTGLVGKPEAEAPAPEVKAGAEEQSEGNGKDKAATPKDDAPKPYTAEELRKMGEEHGAEAAHLLDEKRLEADLLEKKKAMDAMFTKERQDFANKEKELQAIFRQAQEALELANKRNEKLKELLGDEPEDDPKVKELSEQVTKQELVNNWNLAQSDVRELFPDYGMYDDGEMLHALQQYPMFKELAMEKNGKYGAIVLAAAHFLTQRNPENFSKLVEAELEENPEAYKAVLSKHVKAKLEELEKNAQKQESISQAKSEPTVKKEVKPPERKQGDWRSSLADNLATMLADPDKVKEAMAKRR